MKARLAKLGGGTDEQRGHELELTRLQMEIKSRELEMSHTLKMKELELKKAELKYKSRYRRRHSQSRPPLESRSQSRSRSPRSPRYARRRQDQSESLSPSRQQKNRHSRSGSEVDGGAHNTHSRTRGRAPAIQLTESPSSHTISIASYPTFPKPSSIRTPFRREASISFSNLASARQDQTAYTESQTQGPDTYPNMFSQTQTQPETPPLPDDLYTPCTITENPLYVG